MGHTLWKQSLHTTCHISGRCNSSVISISFFWCKIATLITSIGFDIISPYMDCIRSSNRSTPFLGIRDGWYEKKNRTKSLKIHRAKWTIFKLSSLFNKTPKFHAKCGQYKHAPILCLSMHASIGEFRGVCLSRQGQGGNDVTCLVAINLSATASSRSGREVEQSIINSKTTPLGKLN